MAIKKYTNSFGFYKTHLTHTNTDKLTVDTDSGSLTDIESGELIYMDAQVPTKLDNTVAGDVAKYLVAEDYNAGDPYIVVYLLQPIHEITGGYDATLSIGDDVLVHASEFDTVDTGAGQEAQGTIVKMDDNEVVVKLN